MRIVTNHIPREIIDGSQLSMSAKAQFDYLDWEAIKDGSESASFFRYKGELYDLGEFQPTTETQIPIKAWDGYLSDSFFSGILVKYTEDHEGVIIGTYYVD